MKNAIRFTKGPIFAHVFSPWKTADATPPEVQRVLPPEKWFLGRREFFASWDAGNKLSTRVCNRRFFEYTNLSKGSVYIIQTKPGSWLLVVVVETRHIKISSVPWKPSHWCWQEVHWRSSLDWWLRTLETSAFGLLFEWNDQTTVFQRRWGGEISGDDKNKWENGNKLQHVQSCKKRSK